MIRRPSIKAIPAMLATCLVLHAPLTSAHPGHADLSMSHGLWHLATHAVAMGLLAGALIWLGTIAIRTWAPAKSGQPRH